jgi:dihydrofolate reductase
MIKVAFACGSDGEFGLEGSFPWGKPFKRDMEAFKEFTNGCVLVMGKLTFESLPCILRGLDHVVLTSSDLEQVKCKNGSTPSMVNYVRSEDYKDYLDKLQELYQKDVCVIGGAKLIQDCLGIASEIMYTVIIPSGGEIMKHDVAIDMNHVSSAYSNFNSVNVHSVYNNEFEVGIIKLKNEEF